ncbi:MAG: GerMN domain-containing protein [Egibacteraceae bacterium]
MLAALVLVSACRTEDEPPAPEGRDGADDSAEPVPAGDLAYLEGDEGVSEVTAWFLHANEPDLWVAPGTVHLDAPTTSPLDAAIDGVVSGRPGNPEAARRLAPPGTRLLGVDLDAGVATVDLSGFAMPAERTAIEEQAFAQQLAHTATQFHDVDAVRLHVRGQAVAELWGHLDWSEPQTADPGALAPVIVESPRWAAVQPAGSVTASGSLAAAGSTVQLRLIDPTGTVVEEASTTASEEDVGGRGRWEHAFETEAVTPGRWAVGAAELEAPAERAPFRMVVRFAIEG